MSSVAAELEKTLGALDAESAASLERVIRDMLVFAQHRARSSVAPETFDPRGGYPDGHFERLLGAWSDLEFELPEDLPAPAVVDWT